MNAQYWQSARPNDIPGANRLPQGELYSHLTPQSEIIDIGCGNGLIAQSISQHGFRVTGIDINADAIAQAKNRFPEVTFIHADITQGLPFPDDSFDAIILGFILVNVLPKASREILVREFYRILRPRGIVWFHEGLVSEKYEKRYALCRSFVSEEYDFFSFTEKELATQCQTVEQLQQAISDQKVERTVHHFQPRELQDLFQSFLLLEWKVQRIWAPRSGSPLESVVGVVQKQV